MTIGVTDGLKPDGQTTSVGGLPMSIRVSPHPIDFSGTLNNILLHTIYRYGRTDIQTERSKNARCSRGRDDSAMAKE